MPIDYSKWDALQVSSSEDELKPKVTKFDKPQSITIQSHESIAIHDTNVDNHQDNVTFNSKSTNLRKLVDCCNNGGIVDKSHVWGQSRTNIWALIALPKDTKGKNLRVEVSNEFLKITDTLSSKILLDKMFTFTINSEYDFYNWEIIPHSNFVNDDQFNNLFSGRIIFEITMTKLEKFESICSWWPSVFKDDPTVDVEKFKDRKGDNTTFKKNWDEANRMFKERVANFKKIEL